MTIKLSKMEYRKKFLPNAEKMKHRKKLITDG
jgi:hypothetical protein